MNDSAKTNKGLQFFKILARHPYRFGLSFLKYLRKKYNRVLQVILISNISKTPVVSCVLRGRPEIHSLVAHRDTHNYILAIKSLLRFYNDVTVIVHDDGLTKKDKDTIKRHIKNIHIIDRDYADEKIGKILDRYPNCRRYRDEYVIALQLFDYMLLSESDKIVSLDSDILFFKRPDTLIDWLRDGKKIIYFWEEEPHLTRTFLAKINLDDCFVPVNIGLLCLFKETMSLDLIEQILSKVEIFDWYIGQYLYTILLKKQEKHELSYFDPSQYQDRTRFSDGQTARHYWFSGGRLDIYFSDSKKIVRELLKANADKV
jgi:hypothetical protein